MHCVSSHVKRSAVHHQIGLPGWSVVTGDSNDNINNNNSNVNNNDNRNNWDVFGAVVTAKPLVEFSWFI